MLIRLFLLIALIILIEYYFFQALKNIFEKHYRIIVYTQIFWNAMIIAIVLTLIFYKPHQWNDVFTLLISIISIIEISKLFGSIFMLIDDIRRGILLILSSMHIITKHSNHSMLSTNRANFFSQISVLFTFIPLIGFIYGMWRGAYKYKIHTVHLYFPELPKSFDGLKIVQISDWHLGSFFNTRPAERILELVMNEQADIIVFTGDLINNIVEEAIPYTHILSQLKAPLGVYSILGNHDYGDYIQWPNNQEKQKNLQRLIKLQKSVGWNILLNEHKIIEKNGEQIALIGVENWSGNLHFPKYGKLDVAHKGTEHIPFKILMSHDPSHWDLEVSKYYPDIALTLSGHTHGFQFGIEQWGLKVSPVKWVYKHWAGLYCKSSSLNNTKTTQYLYVNRGIGFIGYPGRLGIWPEITVIHLNKG